MDSNPLILAFIAALFVLTPIALLDMRRRSDLAERDRARSSWLLVIWLPLIAVFIVVGRDELSQRTYNALEWAVMIFGAGLAVALTAGMVYVWWYLRH